MYISKPKISLHKNLVYVPAFLVNATTVTVMDMQYIYRSSLFPCYYYGLFFLFVYYFLYTFLLPLSLWSMIRRHRITKNGPTHKILVHRFSFIMKIIFGSICGTESFPFTVLLASLLLRLWCKYWTVSSEQFNRIIFVVWPQHQLTSIRKLFDKFISNECTRTSSFHLICRTMFSGQFVVNTIYFQNAHKTQKYQSSWSIRIEFNHCSLLKLINCTRIYQWD